MPTILSRKPGGGGSGGAPSGSAGGDLTGTYPNPTLDPTAAVITIAKDGSTGLAGDVTLSEGTGVTLTQVGQDIEIASVGGGTDLGYFNVMDCGATGDGVTNDTAAIQSCIDDCSAAGGGVVYFPPGVYKVTTLNPMAKVHLVGAAQQWQNSADCSVLLGTAGSDIIDCNHAGDTDQVDLGFRNLIFSGGDNQILVHYFVSGLWVNNCVFRGAAAGCAGIRVDRGSIEELYVRDVFCVGNDYFYKHDSTETPGGSNYIDKSLFDNVHCTSIGITAWDVRVNFSNSVTFINPVIVDCSKHGLVGMGGLRSWVIINANTESNGGSGKKNRTTLTGTVSSGATSATLASATGWATGDGMTIAGAGNDSGWGGDDFTILSTSQGGPGVTISGTTVSWTGGTGTTVTDPVVTNAEWDDFHFEQLDGAGPTNVAFIGGQIGGEGNSGRLRYGVYCGGQFRFVATATTDLIPLYDVSHTSLSDTPSATMRAGAPQQLFGTGAPEGNVVAPKGSTYQRVSGGAATSLYVKETGSAATGWVGK